MELATATTVENRVTGVEVTIMSASLQLHTAEGGINLQLSDPQAAALRQDLSRFSGFKVDSDKTPVTLDRWGGNFGRSKYIGRPVSGLNGPDCQVTDVSLHLVGHRLVFGKGVASSFINLTSTQA